MSKNPIIVCAACKHGDLIIAGARHFDMVMHSQLTAIFNVSDPEYDAKYKGFARYAEQGFIDQFGEFHTREQAWDIAADNHQMIKGNVPLRRGGTLFSEDLY